MGTESVVDKLIGQNVENSADSRTGRHWQRWEIGALVEMLSDGVTTGDVAARLGRSPAAVRREYERLLEKPDSCPAEYRTEMAVLVEHYRKHRDDAAGRSRPGRLPASQIVEQYRSITGRIAALEKQVETLAACALVGSAMDVAGDESRLDPALLSGVLPPALCMGALNLARDIRAHFSAGVVKDRRIGSPIPAPDSPFALSQPGQA